MQIKLEGANAVAVTSPNPKVLALLPLLEGRRRWVPGKGLVFEGSNHNIEVFTSRGATLESLPEEAEDFDLELTQSRYVPATPDHPHQAETARRIGDKRVFALFSEQGTGKSKSAIDWGGRLASVGALTGILILSKKGVHRQWIESEFADHFGGEFDGYFWDKKEVPKNALTQGNTIRVFTINYDALRTAKGMEAALGFCKAHNGHLLIVADESQNLLNPQSQRYKAAMKLRPYSSHRMLLTGTPISTNLTNEWAQLNWLDESILGIKYITTFKAKYCITGGFEGREVVGHKNVEEFRSLVDPWSYRVTKKDIGRLPKQFARWHFDLTAKQLSLIKSLKEEALAIIDSGQVIEVNQAVAILTKIQQITNGFIIDEDKTVHELMSWDKNPRVSALLEWLDADDDRAIVWMRFKKDAEIISQALEASNISFVRYYGGIGDKERAEAVKSFTSSGGAKVFLGNPQSAGTGLNLQGTSNRAGFYSNSFNAIDRWQAEDRNDRIGTIGAVTYTDFVANGGIDKKIIANLKRKKGISELAVGEISDLFRDL